MIGVLDFDWDGMNGTCREAFSGVDFLMMIFLHYFKKTWKRYLRTIDKS